MDNQNALTTTEGFSQQTREMARVETATNAVEAQARAAVESRYIMALQRPRDWDTVRSSLLKECKRPGFAAAAIYRKPIGAGVEGFSIRFVESALRCMTNIYPEVMTIYDDSQKKIVRVSVTDLESNVSYSKDITITKTVERSKPLSDGSYLAVRQNSYGKAVYTIPATDDEILNKENALVSKALRTQGLRLIPGDILDECESLIKKVKLDKNAQDPGAERKALIDAFDGVGVTAAMLRDYLDQDLNALSPAQLSELRALFAAIRDGESTWRDVTDEKDKGAASASGKKEARKTQNKQPGSRGRIMETLKETEQETGPTFAELAEQINTAKDLEELEIVRRLADSLSDEMREELCGLIDAKAKKLEG